MKSFTMPDCMSKATALFDMAKASRVLRENMSLDTLIYHLHKTRDNWEYFSQGPAAIAYKDTLVYKVAQSLPQKYEDAIRNRNAELCFQARQDTFRKAGLI